MSKGLFSYDTLHYIIKTCFLQMQQEHRETGQYTPEGCSIYTMCEPSEVVHMRSIRAKAIARRVKLLIVIVIFYLSLGLLKAEKGAFILKKKSSR